MNPTIWQPVLSSAFHIEKSEYLNDNSVENTDSNNADIQQRHTKAILNINSSVQSDENLKETKSVRFEPFKLKSYVNIFKYVISCNTGTNIFNI